MEDSDLAGLGGAWDSSHKLQVMLILLDHKHFEKQSPTCEALKPLVENTDVNKRGRQSYYL